MPTDGQKRSLSARKQGGREGGRDRESQHRITAAQHKYDNGIWTKTEQTNLPKEKSALMLDERYMTSLS